MLRGMIETVLAPARRRRRQSPARKPWPQDNAADDRQRARCLRFGQNAQKRSRIDPNELHQEHRHVMIGGEPKLEDILGGVTMRLIFMFAVLLLAELTNVQSNPVGEVKVRAPVSIIRLLADPLQFDGKSVAVVGFLAVNSAQNMVYLHREDYDSNLTVNGLNVEFDRNITHEDIKRLNFHYVYLSGIFDAGDLGHPLTASGTIKENLLAAWPQSDGKPAN
jgi:hypothetical protein